MVGSIGQSVVSSAWVVTFVADLVIVTLGRISTPIFFRLATILLFLFTAGSLRKGNSGVLLKPLRQAPGVLLACCHRPKKWYGSIEPRMPGALVLARMTARNKLNSASKPFVILSQ